MTTDQKRKTDGVVLWADYAAENLELMRSYSVTATEALLRGNIRAAREYFDLCAKAGKEVRLAFSNIAEAAE